MYELEVAPRNLVNTPNSEFSLPKRHVEFFCFSFDGVGLVTVTRNTLFFFKYFLKFNLRLILPSFPIKKFMNILNQV